MLLVTGRPMLLVTGRPMLCDRPTDTAWNGLRPVWKKMLQTLIDISAKERPADGGERPADRKKWSKILHNIWETVRTWPSTAQSGLSQLRTNAAQRLRAIREHLDDHSGFIGAISALVNAWATEALASMDDKTHPHDEPSAIVSDTQDLEILLNADRLHGNDEVVDTTISRVVAQTEVKWQDAVAFTQGLIRNRLSADPFAGEPGIIDLKDLSPRAWAAIHNLFFIAYIYQSTNNITWINAILTDIT
ncbi:hypothetical protein BDW22DRAFT_1348455 [Trametopsis cervina]|nr:hypothetical protein BDW22DRAFT_1348455 [Trametopsis cervina]